MNDPIEALILDLLEALAPKPRAYSEVMEAWRTSCPRLPVWEEANDRGFICRQGSLVVLTPAGQEHLAVHRGHDLAGRPGDPVHQTLESEEEKQP